MWRAGFFNLCLPDFIMETQAFVVMCKLRRARGATASSCAPGIVQRTLRQAGSRVVTLAVPMVPMM